MKRLTLCMALALLVAPEFSYAFGAAENVPPALGKKFTSFRLDPACKNDPLIAEITREAKSQSSIFDLVKLYTDNIKKGDSQSLNYQKLEKLFECGQARELDGYFHGLSLVLETGPIFLVDFLSTLSDESLWTGKIFYLLSPPDVGLYTDEGYAREPTFLGMNCFRTPDGISDILAEKLLKYGTEWKEATNEEKQSGFDFKGTPFISKLTGSLDPKLSGKEIFQINYRWPRLKNLPPLNYLIDEIVEIGDGLYLGQFLFAENMLRKYDPTIPPSLYRYRNLGYWILIDNDWYERFIKKEHL